MTPLFNRFLCLKLYLGSLLLMLLTGHTADAKPVPASLAELTILSQGDLINGVFYRAAGSGTHPTVIFLHGFPGFGRNVDLALLVRRAGYNTISFDYRGNWGSGGTFTPANALQDVTAVLAWTRDPAIAAQHGIDTSQISLIGHSFGGWLSIMTGTRDPSLRCIAALDSWNVGLTGARFKTHPDEMNEEREYFESTTVTGGPMRLDANVVVKSMRANAADWDYVTKAAALKNLPLLLVQAKRDPGSEDGVKLHQQLEKSIRAVGGKSVEMLVFEDDHSFSTHRIELGYALIGWLQGNCTKHD